MLYTRLGGCRRRQIVGLFVVLASIVANALFIGVDLRFRLGLASHLYILLFGIIVADLASEWRPQTRTYRWDAATLAGWVCLIGTMCYSIYLTHIITMQILSQILQGLLHSNNRLVVYSTYLTVLTFCSIAVALLYYLVVERPFARGRFPKLSRGLALGGAIRDVQPNLVAAKSGRHQPADGMR